MFDNEVNPVVGRLSPVSDRSEVFNRTGQSDVRRSKNKSERWRRQVDNIKETVFTQMITIDVM